MPRKATTQEKLDAATAAKQCLDDAWSKLRTGGLNGLAEEVGDVLESVKDRIADLKDELAAE